MLAKITVEAALNVELDDHLGSAKHEPSEASNSRNGTTSKTLQTEDGPFELDAPRERAGSFKPRLVKKHQRRFTSMHDKILFLYAQGMDDPRNRHDIQGNVRSRCLRHTHIQSY